MKTSFFGNRKAIVEGVLAEVSVAVFLMVAALLISIVLSWVDLIW
jgi:hypothetical protein